MSLVLVKFLCTSDYRTPVATTSIFKELKKSFDDVDLGKALAAGTATDAASGEDEGSSSSSSASSMQSEEASAAAMNMLKRLPGINENNLHGVLNAIDCVADLAEMSEAQLVPIIGPVNAKKLYLFFRATF